MNRFRLAAGALAGAVALVAGFGAIAANAAPQTVASGGTSTVTLPLLGASLTVDITTGPGGALTSVAVNPATGLTATTVKPNKVVFVNDAGTAKVVVAGHDGAQRISARAGSLADISGPGSWAGDVFGDGNSTTVNFTVGDKGDGTPDITGVTSSDSTAVINPTQYRQEDNSSAAFVRIQFTKPGLTRWLIIGAALHTEDDGTVKARVGITLSRLRGAPQLAADAAGDKTWTGQLCDGSTATVKYTINADGTISNVSTTPTTADVKADSNRVKVRFSDTEGVRISSHLDDQGNITVDVKERIWCPNAPTPSVNTPTSTNPSQGSHDGHHHGGDQGGNQGNQPPASGSVPGGDWGHWGH
jgi:hypothetical protein